MNNKLYEATIDDTLVLHSEDLSFDDDANEVDLATPI